MTTFKSGGQAYVKEELSPREASEISLEVWVRGQEIVTAGDAWIVSVGTPSREYFAMKYAGDTGEVRCEAVSESRNKSYSASFKDIQGPLMEWTHIQC